MVQALTAALPYIADAAMSFLGKKGAEDSSALQYHYQSLLNQQNYGYNKKLINYQNAFNERMMDKANQWNLDRWNESVDLANTAHQREMADLKSAGLNPILSANGGASVVNPIQSAQASSGNSQLSSSAGMPNIDYVDALSTANAIRTENTRVDNELKNSKTQRQFVRAQELREYNDMDNNTKSTAQQIKESDAKIRELDARIKREDKLANAQIANYVVDNELKRSNIAQNARSNAYTYEQTRNIKRENDWYESNPGFYKFGKAAQSVGRAISWFK